MPVDLKVIDDHSAFNVGHALGAFGLQTDKEMLGALGMAVERGELLRRLGAVGSTEPDGYLIVWPSRHCGLASLVENDPGTGNPTFRTGWPFDPTGIEHAFAPSEVLTDKGRNLAVVTGDIGEVEVTVFDSVCAARTLNWTGEPVKMRLRGWAVSLRLADMTPDRIEISTLQPDTQSAFAHSADADGFITLHKDGAAMLLPAMEGDTPLYRVRGPIKHVSPPRQILHGLEVRTLRLTVARSLDSELDVDVAVSVTNAVWAGAPPSTGQDVEGLIWLQATFDGWTR
jgi:hypothetical protein